MKNCCNMRKLTKFVINRLISLKTIDNYNEAHETKLEI